MDYSIDITDIAVEKIKNQLLDRESKDGYLRLGVQGGGCSGLSYVLRFEDNINDKDLIFNIKSIKILIDKKSITYLNNITLDWNKSLMYQGFRFLNPAAKTSCGCSKSFGI